MALLMVLGGRTWDFDPKSMEGAEREGGLPDDQGGGQT